MKRFFITVTRQGFQPSITAWFYAESEQEAANKLIERMFAGSELTGVEPHQELFLASDIEFVMEQHESTGWQNEYSVWDEVFTSKAA